MARLIDADLAIQKSKEPSIYDLTDFEEFINSLPTVDAEPVRYGKWICVPPENKRGGYECSLCHSYSAAYQTGDDFLSDWCPNCGAKMTGGIDNG